MKELTVDVAIIGHGTAGSRAFRAAKKHTESVVTIEGKQYGTTCARVGCMPSKLLIAAAEKAQEIREAHHFGVYPSGQKNKTSEKKESPLDKGGLGDLQKASEPEINGKEVMKRVRDMRDFFVSHVLKAVEEIPEKYRLKGMANFIDNNTLQIDDHTIVKAKSIVIATGSTPHIPAMLKPAGSRLIINDDVFSWDDLPKSIAVFGLGIIGLEIGQALHRLGVRVKIFGRSGQVGILYDPVMQGECCRTFREELNIVLSPEVHSVKNTGEVVELEYTDDDGKKQTEEYEFILSATGRLPNLKNLHLENTDLQTDEKGMPEFDRETMQCGDSNIFLSGDAQGELQLLHEAADEGLIAGENAALFPKVQKGKRKTQIAVVFTDPQIAIVGKDYRNLEPDSFVIGSLDYAQQGRGRVMGAKGRLHLYAEKKTGKLLGAEIFGPRAENTAHLLTWCIEMDLTVQKMLEMPFYHPVLEEGLRDALREAAAQGKFKHLFDHFGQGLV